MTFGIGDRVKSVVTRNGERLWSVVKDGHRLDAEFLDQHAAGLELRLLFDGDWYSGRRFDDRARAQAHANRSREQLLAKGWEPV